MLFQLAVSDIFVEIDVVHVDWDGPVESVLDDCLADSEFVAVASLELGEIH